MRDKKNHLRLVPSVEEAESSVTETTGLVDCFVHLEFRWAITRTLRHKFGREPTLIEYQGIDCNLFNYSRGELEAALEKCPPTDELMCESSSNYLRNLFLEAYRKAKP